MPTKIRRAQIAKNMTVDEFIDSFLFDPQLSWEHKEIILNQVNQAIDKRIEEEKKIAKDCLDSLILEFRKYPD
jgi:hypothetical protein